MTTWDCKTKFTTVLCSTQHYPTLQNCSTYYWTVWLCITAKLYLNKGDVVTPFHSIVSDLQFAHPWSYSPTNVAGQPTLNPYSHHPKLIPIVAVFFFFLLLRYLCLLFYLFFCTLIANFHLSCYHSPLLHHPCPSSQWHLYKMSISHLLPSLSPCQRPSIHIIGVSQQPLKMKIEDHDLE